jgi:uncharacterized protein YjbI with pentapeptide repeats
VSSSRKSGSAAISHGPRPPAKPKLPSKLRPADLAKDDLEDECARVSLDYHDADLAGRDVVRIEIEQSRLSSVNLQKSHFDRAIISDVAFFKCDLANSFMRDCSFIRAAVSSCRMTGASLAGCAVRDVVFESCPMDLASFRFCKFGRVTFSGCKLTRADFQGANLKMARFEQCDLAGAQFSNAEMEGAYFSDCQLHGINGVASLKGATVRSRDLAGLAHSLAAALGIEVDAS